MDVRLPKAPKKKRRTIALTRVAARWNVRTAQARWILEQAGIEVVPVETEPVPGISMSDLLRYEEQLRATQAPPRLEVVTL